MGWVATTVIGGIPGGLAMIRAMMFDLDGVVVQSEKLKAQAYAIAVQRVDA